MINERKTLKLFGYTSDILSYGSDKKVIVFCDNCYKERIIKFRQNRPLCKSCVMKGKKHSEESKQKMSKSTLGKNNPMYGQNHTIETRQKMIKNHKNIFGKNNPNWNGGSSFKSYCLKFNNKIKEQIRENFNRQCFLCGVLENKCKTKLSVHHVDADRTQGCNNINWKLVPLCISCHAKTSGKYIEDYYENLISRLLYIRTLIFEYENKIDYRSI